MHSNHHNKDSFLTQVLINYGLNTPKLLMVYL